MKRYVIFAVVCVILLTASISATIVAVAFPQIVISFDTSLIVAGWVLGANQVACTAVLPLAGKLGDAYGSKFAFILFICLFTLGSLFCALSTNIELLITARLIQGLGMGGFLPVGTAIVANEFPKSRQQAIGMMSTFFAIGPLIGPTVGAWLTNDFGWASTFWVFVPLGIIGLIATLFLVPKTRGDGGKMDLVGAGLLTAILTSVMVGISLIGSNHGEIIWWEPGLLLALAIIIGFIFLRRQGKIKNPIIDVEVLQEKRFLAANVYNMILGFGLFGITSFIPLYAVSVFGMSTLESGFVMTPRSIGALIASGTASMLLLRWGYRRPMITGTVLTALSLMVMGIISPDNLAGWPISIFWILSLILMINGAGQGIANPAANNACIELMPNRIGTITGVRGMFRYIGAAVGISLTTLILNNSSNLQHGFFLVLVGTGAILLLSLPVILMIPKSASAVPILKE